MPPRMVSVFVQEDGHLAPDLPASSYSPGAFHHLLHTPDRHVRGHGEEHIISVGGIPFTGFEGCDSPISSGASLFSSGPYDPNLVSSAAQYDPHLVASAPASSTASINAHDGFVPSFNAHDGFMPPMNSNESFMQAINAHEGFTPSINANGSFIPSINANEGFMPSINANAGFVSSINAHDGFMPPINSNESFMQAINAHEGFTSSINAPEGFVSGGFSSESYISGGFAQNRPRDFEVAQEFLMEMPLPMECVVTFMDPTGNETTSVTSSEGIAVVSYDPEREMVSIRAPSAQAAEVGKAWVKATMEAAGYVLQEVTPVKERRARAPFAGGPDEGLSRGGPESFSRGGPEMASRGGPDISSRGGPEMSSRHFGPDISARGVPAGLSRGVSETFLRGGPEISSRSGPGMMSRGVSEGFLRSGPEIPSQGGSEGVPRTQPEGFPRGGPEMSSRGGPDFVPRGGPEIESRGGPEVFSRGGGVDGVPRKGGMDGVPRNGKMEGVPRSGGVEEGACSGRSTLDDTGITEEEKWAGREAWWKHAEAQHLTRIAHLEDKEQLHLAHIAHLEDKIAQKERQERHQANQHSAEIAGVREENRQLAAVLEDSGRYIAHLQETNGGLGQALGQVQEEAGRARSEGAFMAHAAAMANHEKDLQRAELLAAMRAQADAAAEARKTASRDEGFSLESIATAIREAVADIATLPPAERKERIKALRVRWHPDKNPILREFATEVSKILNEAVTSLPT